MDRFTLVTIVSVLYLLSLIQAQEVAGGEGRADKQCYSCSGIKCLRQSTFNATKTCSDDCVTTFLGLGGVAFRGCYSELSDTEKKKCTSTNKELCHQCSTDLCNNVGPSSAKCVICTSTTDGDCLQNPAKMSPQPCPVTSTMTSSCYVDASNGLTVRGCTPTVKQERDCGNNPSMCYSCQTTDGRCNQITYPADRRKCYTCSGDNCKTSPGAQYCDHPYDNCIAINFKGTQVKKCSQQRSNDENSFCEEYPQLCVECKNAQCNLADIDANGTVFDNSGSGLSPVFALLLGLCLFLLVE